MIDIRQIPAESSLLDEKTKETIAGVFAKLTRDVTLKAVVDLNEERSAEMASFLACLSGLGPHVKTELYTPEEGAGFAMDTEHLPATGLFLEDSYSGAAFHGVPGGKEINSFVIGIYNLAGPGQEIARGTVKKIEKISRPVHLQICVSLACHHCPGVVIACQRIAMLSPHVTAEMYDANLYPDLVERFGIDRVPLVAVNGQDRFLGPRTIEDLVQLCRDAAH